MNYKGLWIGTSLALACLMGPVSAVAQCETEIDNLSADEIEYMGLTPTGQRVWVGQQFITDCDGQFLTVRFKVKKEGFPNINVRPLGVGDVLTCTLMHDSDRPIATIDQTLSAGFDWETVLFDFTSLELGLAAGTLEAKISTQHDAYCWVATSGDRIDGQLMLGDETAWSYYPSRDAGFKVTWDPEADIMGVENQSWGQVKALFR